MRYRFARRSFLASLGGALGLRILLENLEAAAEGASSPPRLLVAHWPLGTIRQRFLPAGSGFDYQTSPILRPFEEHGLRNDMIVLYGLSHAGIDGGEGGAHEAGTVAATTGAHSPGTRDNGGAPDDTVAGGPSFDQIFLGHVSGLYRPGLGYVNAICDDRVESYETSTRCLSYSYSTRSIRSAQPGGTISEHAPLLPTLRPADLFARLFSGFVPGPGGQTDEALRALRMRKSVLDSALRELRSLGSIVPANEREKIDVHTEAIRKVEQQIQQQIDGGSSGCMVPPAPDPSITGRPRPCDFCDPTAPIAENALHQTMGELHLAIIRAAFLCDIVRVATFQWSPGASQVWFNGLDPNSPNTLYHHHQQSLRITSSDITNGPPPGPNDPNSLPYEFLANVHTWYNARMAEALRTFKDATDAFGSNLLDTTVIPFVTEVGEAAHTRTHLPALIFGGRALGLQGGQFQDFSSSPRPHNDLWMTVAQALFQNENPLGLDALRDEVFVRDGVAPITGLWAPRT
jgi:hypothetical protein